MYEEIELQHDANPADVPVAISSGSGEFVDSGVAAQSHRIDGGEVVHATVRFLLREL